MSEVPDATPTPYNTPVVSKADDGDYQRLNEKNIVQVKSGDAVISERLVRDSENI
jgi:hypothetical protein